MPASTAAKEPDVDTAKKATPVAASCSNGARKGKKTAEHNPKRLEDAIKQAEKQLADQCKGITILEALSATGLRSIRYAQEIPNVLKIVANDLLPAAVETIRRNILFNGIDPKLVVASQGDAIKIMYDSKNRPDKFDVIDLDPYGAPTVFLDSAVQAVKDGGLLLVTCTDMPDLAGNTPETCWAKYGSVSMKTKACKEVALRTLLACLASHAARYGRYIEPLLSLSLDFYIRVFVRVRKGRLNLKLTPTKLSMFFQSTGCRSWMLQPIARTAKTNQQKILPGMMRYDSNTFAEFYNFPFEIGGSVGLWAGVVGRAVNGEAAVVIANGSIHDSILLLSESVYHLVQIFEHYVIIHLRRQPFIPFCRHRQADMERSYPRPSLRAPIAGAGHRCR